MALICPIHKKDDKKECNNYRSIALMNVTYKILSYYNVDRVKPFKEKIIRDYQSGFRENKSKIDQIFIIRQLYQKTWEFNQELHTLYVDFKKAYDSINRKSIYKILDHFRLLKN